MGRPRTRRGRTPLALLGAFLLGVVAHAALAPAPVLAETRTRVYRALDVFADVFGRIQRQYVEPVDEATLIEGAVDGMLGRLDPHSELMTPDEYAQFKDQTRGAYSGIGLEIGRRDERLAIIAPIEGTPADKAGLRAGDRILRIDGESTKGMSVGDAVRRMRGAEGTVLRLRVVSTDEAPRDVVVERARIRIDSVHAAALPGGVAHLRIRAFQEDTADALGRGYAELTRAAGAPLSGVVLDLRNNPGGLLEQAVAVADLFIEDGPVVHTEGRDGRVLQKWSAGARDAITDAPVVVVVNSGSASASEIVAGALQDRRRAVVLGTRTFGKGSVQQVFPLEDASALKLTIARYFSPSGRAIQAKGITPDVEMAEADAPRRRARADRPGDAAGSEGAARAEREADLARSLRSAADEASEGTAPDRIEDPVLQRASELLRVMRVMGSE
jgi:carboxyl-terminal processing protease